MKLVDIAAVAKVVKEHPKVWLVVDNTFMSSYCQVSRLKTLGKELLLGPRSEGGLWCVVDVDRVFFACTSG